MGALTAKYAAPDDTRGFKHELVTKEGSDESSQASTEVLSDLKSKTVKLQQEINDFLTTKMEEDRKAADATPNAAASKANETASEDLYGEEIEDDV